MKGFRSFVFQNLSHVLSSKESQVVINSQTCSRFHSSALSRRFWNFFEFMPKQETCRETVNSSSSKNIATPVILTTNEFDDTSKDFSPSAPFAPGAPLSAKSYGYPFDLKSTPMNCAQGKRGTQQDSLMSLLDGNPVPRTMKWKLKGYKTLRNEQAGDFAFVPGPKSQDYDILSKNEHTEVAPPITYPVETIRKSDSLEQVNCENVGQRNPLCLINKAMEIKEHRIRMSKSANADVAKIEKKIVEGIVLDKFNESNRVPVVSSGQKVSTILKLLTGSVPAKDVKFLPVSKSELSTKQLIYQTQPAAQYSSRPPKKLSKPSAPVLRQTLQDQLPGDAKKFASSVESSREESQAFNTRERQSSPPSDQELTSTYQEDSEYAQKEFPLAEYEVPEHNPEHRMEENTEHRTEQNTEHRTEQNTERRMEQTTERRTEKNPERRMEQNPERRTEQNPEPRTEQNPEPRTEQPRLRSKKNAGLLYSNEHCSEPQMIPKAEPVNPFEEEQYNMEPSRAIPNEKMDVNKNIENQFDADTHFALPSKAHSERIASEQTYESITGLQPKPHPILNIPNPGRKLRTRISPCAATNARLQQAGNGRRRENHPEASFRGYRGPMGSGYSGGSRKPPGGSIPPFSSRHSSSSSCLTKKVAVSRETDDGSMRNIKSNGPSSNISTFSTSPAPRKCDDESDRCNRSRKPQRKCTHAKQKRKRKNSCKRYCCPALQKQRECDYAKSQCPGASVNVVKSPEKIDPTCSSEETTEYREICTSPKKRKRSSKRHKCSRERSCQSQEQSEGREICTKPKKRDTCKQRRKCDDHGDRGRRSAKCTGRRQYSQSAYTRRRKLSSNVKRYFSAPTFALSFIGTDVNSTPAERLSKLSVSGRSYGKDSRPSSCKKNTEATIKCKLTPPKFGKDKEKKADPCKKESSAKKDPCKKESSAKKDPCKKESSAKKDPCKKESSAKKDLCKKESSAKKDPCKKSKSEDTCAKKREDICKARKTAKSSKQESAKERLSRERKEMEECKKGNKNKKSEKKIAAGLERVISPCKQQKEQKSSSKFANLDFPRNCSSNVTTTTTLKQDPCRLLNVSPERNYSTGVYPRFDNEYGPPEIAVDYNSLVLMEDNFDLEELTVPVVIENQEDAAEDDSSLKDRFVL